MIEKGLRAAILLTATGLLLTSCGYKDIDKRYFVGEIGLDQTAGRKDEITITLKLLIPSSTPKAGESSYRLISETGHTIPEAMERIRRKLDKKLELSQVKGIIMGADFAQNGYRVALDWLNTRTEVQKMAYVGIGKPDAANVMEYKTDSERLPGNAMFLAMSKQGEESPYIYAKNRVYDLLLRSTEPGIDPILNIMENKNNTLTISNQAVLDHEKLQLVLSLEETELLLLLMEKHRENSFLTLEEGSMPMTLRIKDNHLSYKFSEDTDEAPLIRLNLKVVMDVGNKELGKQYTASDLREIEEAAEAELRRRTIKLLTKLKNKQLDPIGFGLRYRSGHWGSREQEIKAWNELYSRLEFEVHVKAKLTTGIY
jgi:spore germination protein KC